MGLYSKTSSVMSRLVAELCLGGKMDFWGQESLKGQTVLAPLPTGKGGHSGHREWRPSAFGAANRSLGPVGLMPAKA